MVVKNSIFKNDFIISTTTGLVKDINEDSSGYVNTNDSLIICICDGHWGNNASYTVKDYMLKTSFPESKDKAEDLLKNIEANLFQKFGKDNMNSESDLTPETSILAVEKKDNIVSFLSYGDCRLLQIRDNKIIYELPTKPTWLGAFSKLGLRGRISVQDAIEYNKIVCESGDIIMFFSDGIDECIYETKTISLEWLASQCDKNLAVKDISKTIFDEVEKFGAEDNATLGLLKI